MKSKANCYDGSAAKYFILAAFLFTHFINERGMQYEKNKIYKDTVHAFGSHDDDDDDAGKCRDSGKQW
jgi:hypothetical protein